MSSQDPVLHQRVNGTFIGPVASRTDQATPIVVPIDWNAYDAPRIWDAVRREDDDVAWGQAQGLENLAQLLLSHHDNLKRLRDALANNWDPEGSPTARIFFLFLDELILSMAEDAVAHASTSRGLHGTLTALKVAKDEAYQLKREWDRVTTDCVPEWWDGAADDLNKRARQLMVQTEQAVADHRDQMIIPTLYTYPATVSGMTVVDDTSSGDGVQGSHGGSGSAASYEAARVAPPPPVPGYDPVPVRSPELQGVPGVPQFVPATPGTPISLLPVPPGNPYAQGGGAYILPGRGIGAGGWIYPMPTPVADSRRPATSAPTPRGGPAGAQPVMTGPAAAPGRSSGGSRASGKRSIVWNIAHGVPPVIGDDVQQETLAEEQRQLLDERFVDWFADLATPWTDEIKPEIGSQYESKQ